MKTVSIEELQNRAAEIINGLAPGDEVVILRGNQPVARLVGEPTWSPRQQLRQLGTLKGTVLSIAPDFDAIPEGFEEYVE